MLNQVETCGDYAILSIRRRNGLLLQCMVDSLDIPKLKEFDHQWSAFWSPTARTWYVECRHNQRLVRLHRWLLNAPEDLHVDHWDHDGLNNRRQNIRCVTRTVNQLNHRMQTNNTSGFRGVVWDKGRQLWQARVKVQGQNRLLGRFSNPEEANEVIAAYRKNVLGCAS